MIKSVLIPWSGGMDSTYLIQWYLEQDYDVYAGYINVKNNGLKSKIEKQTIDKIVPIIQNKFPRFSYLGTLFEIDIIHNDSFLGLTQPLLWLTTLAFNTHYYSEIAIGYVMNDCAISFLDDISKVWSAYKGFAYYPDRWPELKFPLIKKQKYVIWNSMDEEIRKLCVWCENPKDDEETGFVICDECGPCKRRKNEGLGNG